MWATLRERKVWTLVSNRLRLSTHIHTRRADIDVFYRTLDEVFRG